MYTLIIFQMIPESTIFIKIPNDKLTPEDLQTLAQAHGKFINGDDDTEAVEKINQYISSQPNHCENEDDPANCKWFEFVVDESRPIAGPISGVFTMGFYM